MLRIRRIYGTPFLRRRMKSAVEGLESRSDRKCIEAEMGVEANGRWSGGGEVIGAFCFSSGDLKPEPATKDRV